MPPKPVATIKAPSFHADVNMRGYNSVLTIDGIDGFSQYCDKGIDVISFNFTIGMTAAGGSASSRINFDGLLIKKAIDKATPMLFKALAERQQIANAAIHIYRDPTAGGKTSEHFFTISLGDVYVTRQIILDPEGKDSSGVPYEEVTITANSIEYNHIKANKVANIMLTQG